MSVIALSSITAVSFNSCVDQDYDLTDDIDMTVQLGGSYLSLPSSTVDAITLVDILDLDSSSSIREVTAANGELYLGDYQLKDYDKGNLKEGDYVLIQDGNAEPIGYSIEKVVLDNISGDVVSVAVNQTIPGGGIPDVTLPPVDVPLSLENMVNLEDNDIPKTLISLAGADTDVDIKISLKLESASFNGTATIKQGYKIDFDEFWTMQITDPETAAFLKVENGRSLVFTKDVTLSRTSSIDVKVNIAEIKFDEDNKNEGIIVDDNAPYNSFKLDKTVKSDGYLSVQLPTGIDVIDFSFVSSITVEYATINSVTGRINPEINVDDISFAINDIPDFLREGDNHLEIDNPHINIGVVNNTPVRLLLNGKFTATYQEKAPVTINIDQIVVEPERANVFVLSGKPVISSTAQNIVDAELTTLLATIPDEIRFHDITCVVDPSTDYTFVLGNNYIFDASYQALVPLAFGPDMRFEYTFEETDWSNDISDLNFNTVKLNFTAISTLPVEARASVTPLDIYGNAMTDVSVVIDGVINASSGSEVRSPISIIIKSESANLSDFDGVRLTFGATSGDAAGTNFNSGQYLRFEDVNVEIEGGVTLNLN